MSDCLFCKLKDVKEDVIWENEYFYSIFDVNPVNPGYALVISKRHVPDILNLNDEEWLHLKTAIAETIYAVKKIDLVKIYKKLANNQNNERSKKLCESMIKDPNIRKEPDAYNIGVNNGEAAGRTIHHVHIHIIPRFKGDANNAAGGIRHILRHKDIGVEK